MLDLLRDDTIAALATPCGRAGLGVIRISGPRALAIAETCFRSPAGQTRRIPGSHGVRHGFLHHPASGDRIDEVVLTVFHAPRSYTGEDVAEIGAHGGPVLLDALLDALVAAGARPAGPGEFTLRAFLTGRLDLSQAEAVADLIDARNAAAHHHALRQLGGGLRETLRRLRADLTELLAHAEAWLDFPDEDIEPFALEGMVTLIDRVAAEATRMAESTRRRIHCDRGIRTALIGRPNVGKSSLFNAILGLERVLVSPTPGTTRDVVEATVDIGGYPFILADTAGLGSARDDLDARGMELSRRQMAVADILLLIVSAEDGLTEADRRLLGEAAASHAQTLVCFNKCDLAPSDIPSDLAGTPLLRTSATARDGIAELLGELERLGRDDLAESIAEGSLVNARQAEALRNLSAALAQAKERLFEGDSLELAAVDVRAALEHLGQIDGESASPDLLEIIFSRFCIGK